MLAVALGFAVLAGCTSIAGTPRAADDPGTSPSASGPSATGVSGEGETPAADTREPSSRDLIAWALRSGEIDEPTSWLYRTWAEFADPSLPGEYQGAPDGHDTELLTSMPFRLDELPTNIRDQVEPYFLRPTNPKSVFSTDDDPPGLRSARRAALGDNPAKPGPWPYVPCQGTWEAEAVPDLPFMVWACPSADHADADGATVAGAASSAKGRIATTIDVVQAHVKQMIADMGPVIPDDPTTDPHPRSDDRIDIYVLPPHSLGPDRDDNPFYLDSRMWTVAASPSVGAKASAYVLVSADEFADGAMFERELVHELFHVLQYTHNATLGSRWFYEASAEWAAAHYVRHDSARLHRVRMPVLQNAVGLSLQDELGLHPYGAYLWPLFMEQEVGAASIFATWKALSEVPRDSDRNAVMMVLNRQLDVARSFPEFVMRLYNAKLPGDPISTRFVDLDPNFPDGTTPTAWRSRTLGLDAPLDIDYSLVPGTGYYYAPVKIAPNEPGSDHAIMVAISGDMHTIDDHVPSLEALVKGENGDYRREVIHYRGDDQQVCVKDEMILVLANQSMDEDDAVEGSARLKRVKGKNGKDTPCGRVEANDPESLARLAENGDTVTVDGDEGDGEPGVAPILVTVSGLPSSDTSRYLVKVTMTGGTLNGPRTLTWPLDDFDEVVPGQYRKHATVLLDNDLTDANRQFTIDVRLVRDGKEIGSHTPTVELHGQKPCLLRGNGSIADEAEAAGCRLVGTLHFSFSGHYDKSPGFTRNVHTDAKWNGDLTVRLKPGTTIGDSRTTFIDDGSSWAMSGSARFELCAATMDGREVCDGNIVEETFSDDDPNRQPDGDDDLAGLAAELAPRLDVWLEPPTEGHPEEQPVVRVRVPIEQDITVSGSLADGHSPPDRYSDWGLGCFTAPAESWNANNRFWNHEGFYTGPEEGATALVGNWNANRTTLDVQCRNSWNLVDGQGGTRRGHVSYSATGKLHLIDGP